jgi:hypothetical protein
LLEKLILTEEDMENEVLVQVVNHFEVGFRDDAYSLFDVQAYLAEHQKLMDEQKNFLNQVSTLHDDMRTLKVNNVQSRENISKPSGGGVRSGSKYVGNRCCKMNAVNDRVKSEAEKEEENDNSMNKMKLDGKDVDENGEKMDVNLKHLYQFCTHQKVKDE